MKKRASTEPTRASAPSASEMPSSARSTQLKQPKLGGARRRAARSESQHLLQEHAAASDTRTVRLALYSPGASEVHVAGTFNNWEPRATPLARQTDGQWTAEVRLNPGRYEYRFIVDGQWIDDPMAGQYVANSFGSLNSVLEVQAVG